MRPRQVFRAVLLAILLLLALCWAIPVASAAHSLVPGPAAFSGNA